MHMNNESSIARLSDREVLDLLFAYVPRIAEERNLDSLLVLMANLGRSMVQADRCSLWLLSENGKELWTRVAHGISEIRIPSTGGFVGHSLQNDEELLIPDAYEDSRFDSSVDKRSGYRTRSVLAVPFKNSRGEVMGVFQAINCLTEDCCFRKQDLEHLRLIAVYSAKAIESSLLFMEQQRTQEEITAILGEAAECRSHETGNHVNRVGAMCCTIGHYLGMSEADIKMLHQASTMHDLGKIGIPDQILNKPGRFTPDEYEVMKQHSMMGYEMLVHSKSRLLQKAAEIAKSHHERYDGKGYPEGIAGEAIPLEARICAVADVFDALTNARCYKDPWPREKVVNLFTEERGKQFDAHMVDILLEHIDEFYAINEKMPG